MKRVNKTCSDNAIFTEVEVFDRQTDHCFGTCSDSGTGLARNTSSACWISCFYKTVLGPDSGEPLRQTASPSFTRAAHAARGALTFTCARSHLHLRPDPQANPVGKWKVCHCQSFLRRGTSPSSPRPRAVAPRCPSGLPSAAQTLPASAAGATLTTERRSELKRQRSSTSPLCRTPLSHAAASRERDGWARVSMYHGRPTTLSFCACTVRTTVDKPVARAPAVTMCQASYERLQLPALMPTALVYTVRTVDSRL